MRIQHNIPAMGAYRNYTNNVSAMKKNLEKLSSGYKINRAGDDAAGLAISEKMRAQITGLETAQKNAKDGISLVQTAEGALTEVHDMLNRMVTLATQSANGTYDNETDRVQLQKEVDQLLSEIDRIADSANFNGIKLLDGNMSTKSISALGSLLASKGIDGTSPSAAGAAEITIQLNNSAATASEVLKSDAGSDVDGSNVSAAKSATFTLVVGGAKGTIGTDATFDGALDQSLATPGTAFTGQTTADAAKWDAGSYLTVKIGSGTAEKTFKVSNGAKDGYIDISGDGNLADGLARLGVHFDTGTNKAQLAAGVINGFDSGSQIVANTTTINDLKALQITGDSNETIGKLFDIKINGASIDTLSGTDKIQNGDKIELVAKKAGEMESDGTSNVYDVLAALTNDVTQSDGSTALSAAVDASLTGSVKAVNGVDENFSTVEPSPTEYTITFDINALRGGQYLTIGNDATNKKLTFVHEDLTTTDGATDKKVNLNRADANGNGTADEIAAAIKAELNGLFGANFDTTNATMEETTPGSGIYTYSVKGNTPVPSSATPGAGETKVEDSNLGAIRVFTENGTEENPVTGPITATYKAAVAPKPTDPTQTAFASVKYTIDEANLKAGNKITIGGKEIEIIDNGATITDPSKQIKAGASGGITANDLIAALEQQGYPAGKVTATGGSGADLVLTITGTEVGQTAADLKAGAGEVRFFDASKTPPAYVQVGSDATTKITAGTTKVSDILGRSLGTVNGNAKTVGDLFKITDANGKELEDDHVFAEGETFKIVAKEKGKLDSAVMSKLDFSGKANVTKKEGFDEGSTATGDKTHYDITFDLTRLAGGNSFTIGNVNGNNRGFTYDLSYDDNSTSNGTIGADDKDDVAGNTTRRTINLSGLSNTEIADKIKAQVQTDLGGEFDVSLATNGNQITLNVDAKKEGAEYNLGNIRYSTQSKGIVGSNYNPAGGAAGGVEGTYAQVSYEFDLSKLEVGDTLTMGSGSDAATIYFGTEDKTETVNGETRITVNLDEAQSDPSKIAIALESAGYRSGRVSFDTNNNTMSITGINTGETAANLAARGGKASIGSSTGRALSTGGLKLQIGDTADDFNQLTVDIKDMHAKSLGLEGLDISNIDSAAKAIDSIKAAINTVSDVRGTLGATQNRLDHTINNLSVMTENIQDAESTIRDTDVAAEMMEYTKNNILIQSAQAMLAQANQMPQGVLQLLQ